MRHRPGGLVPERRLSLSLVLALLAPAAGCLSANVSFGGGKTTREANGGGTSRLGASVAGSSRGDGAVRLGAGVGYRGLATGAYDVDGGGLELRGDHFVWPLKGDPARNVTLHRLGLTTRVLAGWARVASGVTDVAETRGLLDGFLGVSYDLVGRAKHDMLTGRSGRPGALGLSAGVAVTRVDLGDQPPLWIVGGQIEVTMMADVAALLKGL